MTADRLELVVEKGLDSFAKTLHTAMPGVIVSFDAATQLATVSPSIKYKTIAGVEVQIPDLLKVPVMTPRGGSFSITLPVKVNDECLLVFCETSIDRWKKGGAGFVAGQKHYHDLSDGVAIVGLSSQPKVIENYNNDNLTLRNSDATVKIEIANNGDLTLQNNGGQFIIKNNGGYVISNTASGESLLSILQDTLSELSTTTVGGAPLDNAAAFIALATRLSNFTQ